MLTGRALTISQGGVYLPGLEGGEVYLPGPGGCTCLVLGGVPAWSRGGVPAWSQGVYLPGPREGVPAWSQGGSALGGYLPYAVCLNDRQV